MLLFPLGDETWIDRCFKRLLHDRETVERNIEATAFRARLGQTAAREQNKPKQRGIRAERPIECTFPQELGPFLSRPCSTAAAAKFPLRGFNGLYHTFDGSGKMLQSRVLGYYVPQSLPLSSNSESHPLYGAGNHEKHMEY